MASGRISIALFYCSKHDKRYFPGVEKISGGYYILFFNDISINKYLVLV